MSNLDGVTADDFAGHDDAPWVIALTVYSSRLAAGERMTFAEAVDFPEAPTILPATADHTPAAPYEGPPGSGRAAAKPAAALARGSRSATK